MVPLVLVTALVQTSRSWKDDPDRPAAAADVLIVVEPEPPLNSASATSPLLSFLASTRLVPSFWICTPCSPRESWLMSISALLLRIAIVDDEALRRSLPMISG